MKNNHLIIFDENQYYFYCCASLGDTMLTLGLRHALEKKYNAKVIFIIKKTHQIIAKMYAMEDHIIIENDFIKKMVESNLHPTPEKGKIFAAHPCLHPEMQKFFAPVRLQISVQKFLPWLYEFFGVDEKEKIEAPKYYPELRDDFKKKINEIAPIEKIALISPEAVSMMDVSRLFWEELISDILDKGMVPVSNVMKPNNAIKRTVYLKLSIEEVVMLGLHCAEVHSLRSGLCDLLYSRGDKLHVYYPNHRSYFLYCMNDMFKTTQINEKIISDIL